MRESLAMVQVADRTLEPREFPLLAIGPDGGLLKVERCGICGSEVELYTDISPPRAIR